ncbi:YbjN domain-containing protein [Pseudomonas fontis]|uniref:YbjN domain-containing protein n=1 Tax=Pseudomonas fontis TaxID=2942633 RepID=A0ABT5NPZ3_9PSED|nr:YbjN domain-containing protein [Pseudomonas fontis]MDD0974724.1 YbjN domain-containing protein [Pseudomonas fontis]MDD0990219.1 YbjN domain-containing protein [Pseudomonas fontis]
MTATALIETVSADALTTLLQDAGCRVNRSEQNAVVQLLSASQGVGYAVRFGNQAAQEGEFVDFTFSCALRIQGELPAGLSELWNISRRFARLSVQGEFLVMEMDVLVAGGVSQQHLLGNLVLWDRLLQEFIAYLRDYSRNVAAPQASTTVAPDLESAS